jgi:exosortase
VSKIISDSKRVPAQTLSAGPAGRRVFDDVSVLGIVAAVVICAVYGATYLNTWQWLYNAWTTSPDHSHGLLVPVFAVVLIWMRRNMRPFAERSTSALSLTIGVVLIVSGFALKWVGIYCRVITLEAVSILPGLAGIVICCGGWRAGRIAWPSLLFLAFMIPLPHVIGVQLGGSLQHVATTGSTYLMQLLGLPAVAEGNVIYLSETTLGVAEACSGIRMLMSFFALTTALCFVIDRSLWEKCLVWLSAPAIAIVSNVLRIVATGLAYEFGSAKLADLIFHDLAGWLMMPVGLGLLWLEFFVLSRLVPTVEQQDLSLALRRVPAARNPVHSRSRA